MWAVHVPPEKKLYALPLTHLLKTSDCSMPPIQQRNNWHFPEFPKPVSFLGLFCKSCRSSPVLRLSQLFRRKTSLEPVRQVIIPRFRSTTVRKGMLWAKEWCASYPANDAIQALSGLLIPVGKFSAVSERVLGMPTVYRGTHPHQLRVLRFRLEKTPV